MIHKKVPDIKNVSGKTIIIRTDFNVPIDGGKIRDSYRIDQTIPLIKNLRAKGAKIILISHAGSDGAQSLLPVFHYLEGKGLALVFASTLADLQKQTPLMAKKDIILFENIRREKGEMENSDTLARALASLADLYINEAFPASHRAHASIVGIPKYLPSFAGPEMEEEIEHLSLKNPRRPFVFILGGAKSSTKLPLIKKFLSKADVVIVGGALANDFLKTKGYNIGLSLTDKDAPDLSKIAKSKKLLLPIDVVVKNSKNTIATKSISRIADDDIALDAGPESTLLFIRAIQKSKLVVWNGPMGKYEDGFGKATEEMLLALAFHKGMSIVGGGDTVALVHKLHVEKKIGFVSEGGGATLQFLDLGTLVGIRAIEKSPKKKKV